MESTVPVKGLPYNGDEETITYIFKVKYNGTDENKEIHHRFQEFCFRNSDNSYIIGIKMLLDSFETDWKYETLYNELVNVKNLVASMTEKSEEKKNVPKTFGS